MKKSFSLNNIDFTSREIEVLSCLIAGRATKKIASVLSVAPKTIENHIYNIKTKIGCSSKESMIDFVEKSNKYDFIKEYYLNLLIKKNVEATLKNFSVLAKAQCCNCLIFCFGDAKKDLTMQKLEKHLNFAGINIITKVWEKDQNSSGYFDGFIKSNNNNVLYCITKKFADHIKNNNYDLNVNTSNAMLTNKTNPKNILLLLLDDLSSVQVDYLKLHTTTCLNLAIQENYFFNIFKILQTFFPNHDFNKNISEFKEHYEKMNNNTISQISSENSEPLKNNHNRNVYKTNTKTTSDTLAFLTPPELTDACNGYSGDVKINEKLDGDHSVIQDGGLIPENSLSHEHVPLLGVGVQHCSANKQQNYFKRFGVFSLIFLGSFLVIYIVKFMSTHFSPILENQEILAIKENSNYQSYFDDNKNIFLSVSNKPSLVEYYIPRTTISNKIWENLSAKTQKINSSKIVSLYGLAGAGKTFLALNSIYNPKQSYEFRGWFPADNEELLKSAYLELGEKLQLFINNASSKVKIDKVKIWMEAKNSILLIYDNAPDLETLQNYLPNNGHIIITSRNYKLPGAIEVDVMDHDEAVALLDNILPKQIKKDHNYKIHLKTLIENLGRLPLALSQAGSYIAENMINIADYLSLFYQKKDKLFTEKALISDGEHGFVYVSWNINAEAIKQQTHGKEAMELLDFIAYCYPNDIPKSLLTQHAYGSINNEAKFRFNRALTLLRKYSLLKVSVDTVSVHRLVQEWTKNKHSNADRISILKNISATINKIYSLNDDVFQNSDFIRSLMTQAEFILSQIQPLVKDFETLNLAITLGEGYANLEEYHKSKQYLENSLAINNNHARNNHEQTVRILDSLGQIYQRTGDYNKSKTFLLRALAVNEKHFLLNNKTIEIMNNLSNTLIALGEHVESKNLLEKALKTSQEHYSQNHIQMHHILNSLGWNYTILGEYNKSKNILETALALCEKNYGQDHYKTARSLNSVSNIYINLDQYVKSKQVLTKALDIYEKHYGLNHARTAALLSNLGQTYSMIGDYTKSNELLNNSLKIKEGIYGRDHVRTAITTSYIAWNYFSVGEYIKSKQLLEHVVEIFEKQYGFTHTTTAILMNNLGWIFLGLGDYNKSEYLFKQALKTTIDAQGIQHIDSIKISANLGNLYRMLNKYQDAENLLKQALINLENFYGCNNISTARVMASLGLLYGDLGKKAIKKDYLNKALIIFNTNLSERHADIKKTIKEINAINNVSAEKNNSHLKTPGYPVLLDPKAL